MLSLYIRRKKVRTMSLQDCETVAAKFGISPQELQEALRFLHHCVGVLLYYPEVEALKDTVVCQMQVVYDSTSNLVRNASSLSRRWGRWPPTGFEEKGQFFHLRDVKDAMSAHRDDLIPPEKLVKLLEHRNILTHPPSPSIVRRCQHSRPFQLCSCLQSCSVPEPATWPSFPAATQTHPP